MTKESVVGYSSIEGTRFVSPCSRMEAALSAVVMMPGIFELDISRGGTVVHDNANVPSQRKVA